MSPPAFLIPGLGPGRQRRAPARHCLGGGQNANLLAMTDDEIPGFLTALGIPGIVDAHVHFLPDRLQDAIWRWFDRLTPPWPVTYREPAEDRLAVLARVGVRHHTALAYAHQPGMLRSLNDHTLALAAAVPAVIPTFTIYPEPGVSAETERCLAAGGRAVKVHLQVGGFDATDPQLAPSWGLLQDAGHADHPARGRGLGRLGQRGMVRPGAGAAAARAVPAAAPRDRPSRYPGRGCLRGDRRRAPERLAGHRHGLHRPALPRPDASSPGGAGRRARRPHRVRL